MFGGASMKISKSIFPKPILTWHPHRAAFVPILTSSFNKYKKFFYLKIIIKQNLSDKTLFNRGQLVARLCHPLQAHNTKQVTDNTGLADAPLVPGIQHFMHSCAHNF